MELTSIEKRIEQCYDAIQARMPQQPKVALTLGSGLGGFAYDLEDKIIVPYREINAFPVSTVSGHRGQFVFGYVEDVPVIAMQGRIHLYEGYSMEDVVLPIRLMRHMGAEILYLTNAAGGLNTDFDPGDLMMITDQIGSFVPSPLIGRNPETIGTRFPDMSEIYDRDLRQLLQETAAENDISLREGVYVQFSGPNYETPAEVRMAKILGGDAVGMSTACEAIAGNHCGFRICGISCITNLASGLSGKPLSHEEVKQAGLDAGPRFRKLIRESIVKMGKL